MDSADDFTESQKGQSAEDLKKSDKVVNFLLSEEDLLAVQKAEKKELQDDNLGSFGYQGNRSKGKASKRRDKKAKEAKEREERIKEQDILNVFSSKSLEEKKMKDLLRERNLKAFEINADGDCLFASIAHQRTSTSSTRLRQMVANFMRENRDDFAPFMTDSQTGDMMSGNQFDQYCATLESTHAWGGQPELRALSQVLKTPIEVIQAEGTPVMFGEEFAEIPKILLAYYRHMYGLGEHYNSVVPLSVQ